MWMEQVERVKQGSAMLTRTKDLPCLAQSRLITCVKDEYHSVTFVIVPRPDRADIALTTEVEEMQGSRWQRDLTD